VLISRCSQVLCLLIVFALAWLSALPEACGQSSKDEKPVTLYGRIEEIAASPGAQLPIKLKLQKGKLDLAGQLESGASKSRPLSGELAYSYPVDWRGVWSGTLKVWSAQFDPLRFKFDAQEARREKELMTRGTEGQVSFEFSEGPDKRVTLKPTQVIFSRPAEGRRYADAVQGLNELGSLGNALSAAFSQIPYLWALHLGDLKQGIGVTGNLREAQVLKNDLRQLAAGILEQNIVNYTVDENRQSGRRQEGYAESVVRFYRQSNDELYVQAATIGYTKGGRFMDKILLYGTVKRGASGVQIPGLPGGLYAPGFPFNLNR